MIKYRKISGLPCKRVVLNNGRKAKGPSTPLTGHWPLCSSAIDSNLSGPATAAWGQIKLHLLHWVQRSMSTSATRLEPRKEQRPSNHKGIHRCLTGTGCLSNTSLDSVDLLCTSGFPFPSLLGCHSVWFLSCLALGTLMAIPRFSYWLVPNGTRPPGTKVLTGRELPSSVQL